MWEGDQPEKVVLRCRDPIECLAYKLVDPVPMIAWSKHVKFNSFQEYSDDKGQRVYGDLMSSVWAENTERQVRAQHGGESHILPLILYHDGVVMGNMKGAHAVTVMGSCGLFSDELLRTNAAKFCLGFINGSENINKNSVIRHLMNKAHMNISTARRSLKKYLLQIDRQFFRMCMSFINEAHKIGILLYTILNGVSDVKWFIPVLSFHGDVLSRYMNLCNNSMQYLL